MVDIVKAGRFGSAAEVVREGLRLVEEREAKLESLRQMVDRSIAEGGELTDEEIAASIAAHVKNLRAQDRQCH